MTNPVLVEVTRGTQVELRHRGAIAIVDAAGRRVAAIGDVEAAVFPRSAVKAIQALPLVESGAADAYGFGNAELALASASHSGEPRHVETATAMLAAAGRAVGDLACGPHMPISSIAERSLIRSARLPGPLHNNCSGKHAGFICTASHLGIDPAGYVAPDHPVQRMVTAALAELTGVRLGDENRAVDGCSIPAYAIPIHCLALGFARMATGEGLPPSRAAAVQRIFAACMAEPFMMAGAGRFCTDVMTLFSGRVFVKGGAEGVYCGALPGLGLGVAVKCDDGAGRASEAMMAAVIEALVPQSDDERVRFAGRLSQPVLTRRGARAGVIRPVDGLVDAIREGRDVP